MATGVPKKHVSGATRVVSLQYEGKTAEAEVLAGAGVSFRQLHCGSPKKRLYFGDNLDVLHGLLEDPDICGKVNLVYIDPPFATQSTFQSRRQEHAYSDTLAGGAFVEFLRRRLILLRELLSARGSLYLHLDEKMVFEMKIVLDEIFGARNYRNVIVRKKCNPKNYTRRAYGNIADFILFYTKTDKWVWNPPVDTLSEQSTKEYHYVEHETGRRFMKVPLHAPGTRNGETGKTWRGMLPPPGKHWQYPPSKLEEMDARGEIFWSKNGNPRRKVYLDEHPGVGVQDIWLEYKDAHNQNIRITGYPTEKNPDLLRRIVQASSNPGDIVLDCFAGSGTTLAVADELQRDWVGVDNAVEALKTILQRFERGLQPMGDYVQARNKERTRRRNQRTLFDSLAGETDEAESQAGRVHKRICDFTILSCSDNADDITRLVREWQNRNGLARKDDDVHAVKPGSGRRVSDC